MILSLDIAFANTGWVVLEQGHPVSFGTIRTEKDKRKSTRVSDDRAARAAFTASELDRLIREYQPKGLIGELPGGSQSAAAATLLGYASGVVVAVATCHKLPCEWISEGDSKKAAIGKRTGTKEEMMEWARKTWPAIEFPTTKAHFEHVADALAAYNGLRNGMLVRMFG